jgi:uncharacterized protein (TIGR02646 family)
VIGLERTRAPGILSMGELAERARLEAHDFFSLETRSTRQRQYDFEQFGLLDHPEVAGALTALSDGRCAFCSRGGRADAGLAAHRLRPPQDAVASDGTTSRRHYWWLAYEWRNLYPACTDCRHAQGAKFPTASRRVRVGTTVELAEREEPLLLDPCADDPEAVLIYLDQGEVVSSDQRGKATIETFDLNRPALIEERAVAVASTRTLLREAQRLLDAERINEFADALVDLYLKVPPFAAVRRQFVNQWVQFRWRRVERALALATGEEGSLAALVGSLRRVTNRDQEEAARDFFGMELDEIRAISGQFYSRPKLSAEPPQSQKRALEVDLPYLSAAEIRRVEIRNFRAIESLDLEVARGPGEGSWMMLLGENGAGKTSVLQAIALTLCDAATLGRLELDPTKLLRHGTRQGRVRVTLTGSNKARELLLGEEFGGLRAAGAPREGTLIAGYGSARLLPKDGSRKGRRITTIENLFDPLSRRVSPRAWLVGLASEEFDAVARALRPLLQLDDEEEIVRHKKAGLQIVRGKNRLELSDLSDGYKAMAVLALDMMQLFLTRWGGIEAAEGIVLIDELGAHLHPRWQMRVTESLRITFPRVQFVATTHDPLCLRGLHDGEVVVLRRRGERIYAVHDQLPPIEGLTVDQLLTSEHFGLSSSLDPAIEERFSRYYELLAQRRHSRAEQRELAELTDQLVDLDQLGATRRERLALEAVDEALAEERRARSGADLSRLNESAKQQVRAIWQDLARQ